MASQNPTATTPLTAWPTTPFYSDDLEWITAYLDIHVLSDASMVYAYILWVALAVIVVVYSAFHLLGLRVGYLGAYWTKWAVRRRTWRKKHTLRLAQHKGDPHRQPLPLPSNAQILTLAFLVLATLALSFVGPDYFAPGSMLWTVHDTPTVSIHGRALSPSAVAQFVPDYTIRKAWWTSGNRTGLIAFALFPLCILLALKSPPFAILSLPFVVQLHFDKLAWIHKWIGRLIWLLSALHVALWSVQLSVETRNSTGKVVYTYAWEYRNFIYGWIAFGVLTLLVASSFRPVRQLHYELFYFLHILLVPLTLIFSALHHPPVWWWCWAALAVWVGERLWRLTWWLHTNGYFGGMLPQPAPKRLHKVPTRNGPSRSETWEMDNLSSPKSPQKQGHYSVPSIPKLLVDVNVARESTKVAFGSSGSYVAPPGFAHVELLPGRTVRLRLITPGYLPWAPGQHFLLSIPAVSKLTTHPFTNATLCDQEAPTDEGRELVFLVRAKNGWTKRLWELVSQMAARGQAHVPGDTLPANCEVPNRGVLLRACVDGPFGSAARANWGSYSTVLIVAGGSGVSFGLSVLQYVCLCLAGRNGIYLGGKGGGWGQPGFKTRRVRFVWLVREFSHIQWCATLLRRCMAMVHAPELQVDIFVTNVKPFPQNGPLVDVPPAEGTDNGLAPPAPRFALEDRQGPHPGRGRSESVSSVESDADSFVDLSYYTGDYVEEGGELGHEEHVLDLTNFEGDDDTAMPGETQFNRTVKREGKLRRAASRGAAALLSSKSRREGRTEKLPLRGVSPVRLVDQGPTSGSFSPIEEHRRDGPHDQDIGTLSPISSHAYLSPQSVASSSTLLSPDAPTHTFRYSDPHSPGASQFRVSGGPGAVAMGRPLSTASHMSEWSDVGSLAALVSEIGKDGEHLRLELDEQELQDVGIVAEHARPGKPRLDRILADEVRQAQGPIVVGCCGPLSLNAVMRKTVAAHIDPGRIRQGDLSGSITLISEDFEY